MEIALHYALFFLDSKVMMRFVLEITSGPSLLGIVQDALNAFEYHAHHIAAHFLRLGLVNPGIDKSQNLAQLVLV